MNDLTPSSDDPHQQLMEKVDADLDVFWARWDTAMRPVMEGARDVTRSVINLSAGALILSLTVTQFLQDGLTEAPASAWLLPVAWVLLTLAIVAGVFRQGRMPHVVAQRAKFEAKRGAILRLVREVDLGGDVAEQIDQILLVAMESADVTKDTSVFDIGGHIMIWSFLLALVALVVFTLRNMPF